MTTTNTDTYVDIVGQEQVKNKLRFFLDGYKDTGSIPFLFWTAERGTGKTSMALATGRGLIPKGAEKYKPFVKVNCGSIQNTRNFVGSVILQFGVPDREMTLFFDEAAAIPKDVQTNLLTITEPNKFNKSEWEHGGSRYIFDFNKLSLMFATTNPQAVNPDLINRCERIDLQPYTQDQLALIMKANTSNAEFESDDLVRDIVSTLRGNARIAANFGRNYIAPYLKRNKKKKLMVKDWSELRKQLGIAPLGLTPIELSILDILSKSAATRLSHVAAKMGLTVGSVQRDFELFLIKNNLIQVEPEGRVLTGRGREILNLAKV